MWIAVVSNRHGVDILSAEDEIGVDKALANWAVEWASEMPERQRAIYEAAARGDNVQAYNMYFAGHGSDFIDFYGEVPEPGTLYYLDRVNEYLQELTND